MRILARVFVLFFLLLGGGRGARAQSSFDYTWYVTHDMKLTALVTGSEAIRAGLENQFASQKAVESSIWSGAAGTEAYSWLRTYAQFLRTLRSFEKVKEAILLMKIPVWTLMPQIGFVAPVQYKDPDTGKTLTVDKEIASLSVVPPAYQAHWMASNYYQDDEVSGASDIKGGHTLVKFKYPHKLSDIQLTFSPSPFLDDYAFDESQAIDDLKAHFFEALMDSASRLAGFGVSFNPQVLADGSKLVEGRMSPAQLKLQATIYENQAMEMLRKIHQLYIDHGVSFDVADRMVKADTKYWDGFGTRMQVMGSARVMFAMNMMNEIHQSIGRLDAYQRRMKVAETDEAMANIGKKKNPDGTWSGFLENSSNFWDMVDKIAGIPNGGKAVRLQAEGLSARYARFQFDEAEGLRNILMGKERMNIALEGIVSEEKQRREIEKMNKQEFDAELLNHYEQKRKDVLTTLTNTGWGALKALGDS